jgi:thymidylate synthase
MKYDGIVENSRNGLVMIHPMAVTTVYKIPEERVLFDSERRPNPFFHLAECVWIMSGSNDLAWISKFNSNMGTFSDDGKTINGAYGHRLRSYFGKDQITTVVKILRSSKEDRRAVLTMWDPRNDLGSISKDVPCNTQVYLRINSVALDMMVTCRSNDVIWGAYGANAVHFSFLQEYLAWAIGVEVGTLCQVSFNYHIYERHWHLLKRNLTNEENPYTNPQCAVLPLRDRYCTPEEFLFDCEVLVGTDDYMPESAFLRQVFIPMQYAWENRAHVEEALEAISPMPQCDWKLAAYAWFNDKENKDGQSE